MMEGVGVSREPAEQASGPALILTLADVMARLEADPDLAPGSVAQMLSAIRTLCRLLKTTPSMVPAEPRNLSLRIDQITHASAGLSKGRWNNIRSLVPTAVRQAGIRAMPGGSRKPLAFPWEVLRAAMPDTSTRAGLSRFISFCNAQGIMPDAVDASVFERFRDALVNESFVREPRQVYRRSCLLSNQVAGSIPGWPNVQVPVPDERRRYSFAWEDFPPTLRVDTEAYLNHLGNEDPFAENYLPALRPKTVKSRRKQILQLASAAVHHGCPIQEMATLADLVKAENVERALRFLWERGGEVKKESLHQQAILLRNLARHWTKAGPSDLKYAEERCRAFAVKKNGMVEKNRLLLKQFDDPANVDALLSLPARLLREVQDHDKGGRRDAVRVASALAIELLINAPIRVENLTELKWEGHFLRSRLGPDHIVHLSIKGGEIKNEEPFEVELPKGCADFLDLYLQAYRPRLTPVPSPWLFPGYGGECRNIVCFSRYISKLIHRETGIVMHVHLFRALAVKFHLDAHPEDVETARRILGHKSLKTTLRAYADMKNKTAFRRFDAMISEMRERTIARPRPGRRKGVA
jgi:integrase